MTGTLLNLIMPFIALGLVYFIVKRRKLSFKNDIGIVFPTWQALIFWVVAFAGLIMVEEWITQQSGNAPVESWIGKYSTGEIVLRSLGIVLLAPLSEELLFRGLLYSRIKETPLKYIGAIVIPAIIFALIHIQYSEALTFVIIFVDGLFLGLARHYSKSVLLAFLLHALANLGAVIERLY
ncbi:MAG: hypothetical protein DHS20C18_36460 [Saprospiraceae bacterium]|nr:MAG: hypothetical protein DHS20C18_36460 [Saprospiraceae bacterium]